MSSTFDVRIWAIRPYVGTKRTTYTVRWMVAGTEFRRTFVTKSLADGFRAPLVSAQRQGEPFDTRTGLPEAMRREQIQRITWYEHAMSFIDMKWSGLEGGSRRTLAESLGTITCALVDSRNNAPEPKTLYRALVHWAFNYTAREKGDPPDEYAAAIAWIARHSIRLSTFTDPKVARAAYNSTLTAPDGTALKHTTATNKRRALTGAVNYAVELGLLENDPFKRIHIPRQRRTTTIDRNVVINPEQARALLKSIEKQGEIGRRMVAFFATIYFAGLRPGEVVALRENNLTLPEEGWGELRFYESSPYSGSAWTDSGEASPRKALKHRNKDECRIVPAHPELVAHLRAHLESFGTTPDGRLFWNRNGKPLCYGSYSLIWDRARRSALTAEQYDSPLARRPYDLRHAAVSTWLNAGVAAPQVAEWAGHTVEILLSTYAKCIDGQQSADCKRIEEALGGSEPDETNTDGPPQDLGTADSNDE